jgi:hypothetical protein
MIKGKAPAFQFYVRDWLADPQLRQATPTTRGIWIDLLCFLWESPSRGELELTANKLARMTGAMESEIFEFCAEAKELGFCDISVSNHINITVRNRRMWRDEKERKSNRKRQAEFRERQKNNKTITSPSSTSSSSSLQKTTKKTRPVFNVPEWVNKELWKDFLVMRNKIKKPVTSQRAVTGLTNKLKLLTDQGYSQSQLFESALVGCWQTFYEPKEQVKEPEDNYEWGKGLQNEQ